MLRALSRRPQACRFLLSQLAPSRSSSAVSPILSLSPGLRWSALSKQHQDTLRFLGCAEEQWNGVSLPPSIDLPHARLTLQQQAAVLHGLGMTATQWDEFIEEHRRMADERSLVGAERADSGSAVGAAARVSPTAATIQVATTTQLPSSTFGAVAQSAAKVAWGVAKFAVPMLRPVLERSKHPLAPIAMLAGELFLRSSVLVEATQPPVPVEGLENLAFLDDSGSMSSGGRLGQGHDALRAVLPLLGSGGSMRIVKFGSHKTLVAPREAASAAAGAADALLPTVLTAWDASSGGTYMWHMIEQDVIARYIPGRGKLRACIVTDGEDCQSPLEYQGVGGLSPMMRTLKARGYDVEWFIILVGDSISAADARTYRSLAHATGGEFLALGASGFNASGASERRFLDALRVQPAASQQLLEDERAQRQRQYEIDAKSGRADKFDWYVALPPPTKGP